MEGLLSEQIHGENKLSFAHNKEQSSFVAEVKDVINYSSSFAHLIWRTGMEPRSQIRTLDSYKHTQL